MIKNFIKNSAIYTFGSIITKGMSIFIIPIYTRFLSVSEFGVMDLFSVISSIVNIVITLEISQAVAMYYQSAKNNHEKTQYVSTAFLFTLFIYMLYLFISLIFSKKFAIILFDDILYKDVFIYASISISTSGIFYFTYNQLKWQIQPKNSMIVSVLNVAITALVAIYLLIYLDLKVHSIFIGQIFGNIISSALAIYFTKNTYMLIFNYQKLKEMIKFSFPLVFSGIVAFIGIYADRIAIKDLLGLQELGIYGVAYRFASISSLVMIGFQNSLMPLIYKNYKKTQTSAEISQIFNIFVFFALVILAASIVFSKDILMIFTTKEFFDGENLIPILVLSIFFSNMYIFAPGLFLFKKTKQIAIISIINGCMNIALNYILIPKFGIIAAAIGTLLSSIMSFALYVMLSCRYYPISYNFIKHTLALAFVLLICFFISNEIQIATLGYFAIKLLCLMILAILLALMLFGKNILEKIIFFTQRN